MVAYLGYPQEVIHLRYVALRLGISFTVQARLTQTLVQ